MSLTETAARAAFNLAKRNGEKDSKKPVTPIENGEKISFCGDAFTVGYAAADITPYDYDKKTYWMAGYGIAKKIRGFLDPLTANAAYIGCGKEGILLVSLDLIGLTGNDVRLIRQSLNGFCLARGIRHITVSCTHTHAGVDTIGYWGPLPVSGKNKEYMSFLFRTVDSLCRRAYESAEKGKLYYGNSDRPELIERWRRPYFFVPRLHRLRFVPENGGKETWFLNFPAHPNTMGGKNTLISADYVCYMRREISVHKDVNIMYAVGAIGAMDIGKVADDDTEKTVKGGMMLGAAALEITDAKELKPEITVVQQKFMMPLDNTVLSLAGSLKIIDTSRKAAQSSTGSGFISEINYIDIGGAQILTHPGECFQELVYPGGYDDAEHSATGEGPKNNPEPLTEIFGNEDLMIFGVTDDMTGYAVAPNDYVLHPAAPFLARGTDRFRRNHYHETNSCGINTGAAIADAARKIKNTLGNN